MKVLHWPILEKEKGKLLTDENFEDLGNAFRAFHTFEQQTLKEMIMSTINKQYRFYANFDDGRTPPVPTATPMIGADGVLIPPTDWDWGVTVPPSETDKTLWVLVGYGKPSHAVSWSGVYLTGVKGDKGDRGLQGIQGNPGDKGAPGQDGGDGNDGAAGQDGLGQYRFYANFDDGTKPPVPSEKPTIDSDGTLSAPTDWSSTVLTSERGETLWVLVGDGKPSSPVSWAGVYRTKGEAGGSAIFYYGLFDEGSTPTVPNDHKYTLWWYRNLFIDRDNSGDLSSMDHPPVLPTGWSKTIPSPKTGKVLWVLSGAAYIGGTVTWTGVYKAGGDKGLQGLEGAVGPKGETGAPGQQGNPGAKGDKGDKGEAGALTDGSVTTDKIADKAVTGVKVTPFTLSGGHLSNGSITARQIANGTITYNKLDSNAITRLSGADGNDGQDGVDGAQGIQGAQGERGLSGQDGNDGAAGAKGDPGQDGGDGNDGADGQQGPVGQQGIQGNPGAKGAAGRDGSDGTKGEKGETGATGTTGAQGIQGIRGNTGLTGQDGTDGAPGQQGNPGAKGDPGQDGSDGTKGEKGETGATGTTGAQGIQGIRGNTGLTGQDGTDGAPGQQGDPGAKGDPGQDGSDGTKGEKGETGATGTTGAQGIQGIRGNTGLTGQDGTDGAPGQQGNPGAKGDPGQDGSDGTKGEKGETGATGTTGVQGNPGAKGAAGRDGDDGADGQQGNPGAKGDPGQDGSDGTKGEKGETGATGTTGVQGNPGAKGAAGRDGDDGADGQQGIQGNTGAQGVAGQDGLGQFRYYANVDNGTTPPVPTTKDAISPTGTLSPPTGWKAKASVSGANKRLWILVGRGRPSGTVTWAGVYKVGEKGEKGDTGAIGASGATGAAGQDGLGQFRYYANVDNGTTPPVPTTKDAISPTGTLSPPTGWKAKASVSGANKRLWILVGRGRPSGTVTWAGVYKVGEKGDTGATGAIGASGATGAAGQAGQQGPTGQQGNPGTPGSPGQDGQQGPTGPQGNPGTPGTPGRPGQAGQQGPTGQQGNPGTPGAKGAPGAPGRDGQDGAKGDPATITDGSITTDKLADGAVTGAKIVNGAITSAKITDGTITNTDLNRNEVSMLEPYKDSVANLNTTFQEGGNVVYHLRFYGRINADFDDDGVIESNEKRVLIAHYSPRGDVKNELTSTKSSPAQSQQGQRGKRQGEFGRQPRASFTDIPDNQARIPNNADYVLINNEKIATVHETTGQLEHFDAPTKEGWGRKPLLRNDQPGNIVVLEGVANKGDYIVWTKTYSYNDGFLYQENIKKGEFLDYFINENIGNPLKYAEPWENGITNYYDNEVPSYITFDKTGNEYHKLIFYGIVNFDFDTTGTITEAQKKVLEPNYSPRKTTNHNNNEDIKDALNLWKDVTIPAQAQQGKRRKRRISLVPIQAQMPNNKDYVLLENSNLWTVDTRFPQDFPHDIRMVSSPQEEGWSRDPFRTVDIAPASSNKFIPLPIIMVLEGIAKMGDYVTWTRTYPYLEREDYEGKATEHTIADGAITYSKLDPNAIVQLGGGGGGGQVRLTGAAGEDGQHGMGQYFRYKFVTDGQTPTEPSAVSIGSNGVLATVSGWTKYIPGRPSVGESLWVLLGRGKAGETITWSGVYKAGQKGERGDPAVGALGDSAVRTSKIADGAVTKAKLGTDVYTVARADTFEEYAYGKTDYNNTFLSAENGQANTTGNYNTASGSGALQSNTTGSSNTASGTRALAANTTGSSNTASGTSALAANTTGYYNTASGTRALAANTTGNSNTASGTSALAANTTGYSNTASGTRALAANTTGYSNTASGRGALYSNTTGDSNTASGTSALAANTTGSSNTASGTFALENNTTGYSNTASGTFALFYNTTGANNIAIGVAALGNNTTGHSNTASGINALFNNTTGDYNTAIGTGALLSNTTGDRNIGIGDGAVTPSSGTDDYINIGRVLTGDLTTGNLTLTGTLTQNSDERLKENIADVQDGLDCVKKLRPITFTRKEIPDPVFEKDKDGNDIIPDPAPQGGQRGSSEVEHGLIAQEVEKVCPDLVGTSEYSEGYKSVDYSRLSVVLLKAIQQQQDQIKTQQEQTKTQQEQIETLKKRIVALEN